MYSAIEHLGKSLWLSRFDSSNLKAMYTVYFDESGHPDDSEYVIVSGLISTVEGWMEFEREWNLVLSEYRVSLFHATDFQSGTGEYESWKFDAWRRKWFVYALIGVIRRRALHSFSTAVVMKDFRRFDSTCLLKEMVGHPYPMAARSCMARINEWMADHGNLGPVEYFFEDGAKHKGQLLWVAEKDRLPTPIFKKKNELIPFQAADMLAWEHTRFLNRRSVSESFEALESMPNTWGVINSENLTKMCAVPWMILRDPNHRYVYRIIRESGKRVPVITVYPKNKKVPLFPPVFVRE